MRKACAILVSTLKELLRERAFLALTLMLAPLFILVYRLIFLQGMVVYRVGLLEEDARPRYGVSSEGPPRPIAATLADAVARDPTLSYSDGSALFSLRHFSDRAEAERAIRDRSIYLLVIIPTSEGEGLPRFGLAGDLSDPYYLLASTAIRSALESAFAETTGLGPSLDFETIGMGVSNRKTPFENYVPGLIIVSSLAGVFLFSLVLARERETLTVLRYRLAELPFAAIVAGKGGAFAILSTASTLIAFASAYALGFRSPGGALGDVANGLCFCLLCSVSVIGISFAVAAFARNLYQALSLAAFPFFFLVFFSGSVYPLPEFVLFRSGGIELRLFDFLPSTHAVHGIHRILTFGEGMRELSGRLAALAGLAALCLAGGGYVYKVRVLSPRKPQ